MVPRTQIVENTVSGSFQINFPFLAPIELGADTGLTTIHVARASELTDHLIIIDVVNKKIVATVVRFIQKYLAESAKHRGDSNSSQIRTQSIGGFFVSELASGIDKNEAYQLLLAGVTISGDFDKITSTDSNALLLARNRIQKLNLEEVPGFLPLNTKNDQIRFLMARKAPERPRAR